LLISDGVFLGLAASTGSGTAIWCSCSRMPIIHVLYYVEMASNEASIALSFRTKGRQTMYHDDHWMAIFAYYHYWFRLFDFWAPLISPKCLIAYMPDISIYLMCLRVSHTHSSPQAQILPKPATARSSHASGLYKWMT
jgi:hypothetical protein